MTKLIKLTKIDENEKLTKMAKIGKNDKIGKKFKSTNNNNLSTSTGFRTKQAKYVSEKMYFAP